MNPNLLKRYFPLKDVSDVVQLFKYEMEQVAEPDLAMLSIILGCIENTLTCNRTIPSPNFGEIINNNPKLPLIEYDTIDSLYVKFQSTIKGFVDISSCGNQKYATREVIKTVSDVVWNSLSRSYYKDRAHLQSLYSYLTGNRLDCFGVAYTIVAACQVLGLQDVHLALSEDHAWVIFGENSSETAEVTWHGKGNEDKRGQPVDAGIASHCWLYLNGYPVKCNRHMEISALVSSINPSLNLNNDAVEVTLLQQELLWLLYDWGHLSRYPMALGNLGDLEEVNPTAGRQPCSSLFEEGILIARTYYNNMHVYPYTYQGGYFYRNNMYKEAFKSWANASEVLKHYNYMRDDEEIYKEAMEIANELIPHIIKVVSSGHSARSILRDPECFAFLLKFYDGICQWEEGSQTPVLHIGWAKPLVNTISKFDSSIRSQVTISEEEILEEEAGKNGDAGKVEAATNGTDGGSSTTKGAAAEIKVENGQSCSSGDQSAAANNGDNEGEGIMLADTPDLQMDLNELVAVCGERILNRDFLVEGGGEPFMGSYFDVFASVLDEGDEHTDNMLQRNPRIVLYSEKMKGLKNLLLGEKLNTQAISLQLTAQSQVQVGGKKNSGATSASIKHPIEGGPCVRSKRSRRE